MLLYPFPENILLSDDAFYNVYDGYCQSPQHSIGQIVTALQKFEGNELLE